MAYARFVIAFIGLALGKDIATVLVMRVLLGLFGYVGTTLVSGTSSGTIDQTIKLGPMACFPYISNLGAVDASIYVEFIDETVD